MARLINELEEAVQHLGYHKRGHRWTVYFSKSPKDRPEFSVELVPYLGTNSSCPIDYIVTNNPEIKTTLLLLGFAEYFKDAYAKESTPLQNLE